LSARSYDALAQVYDWLVPDELLTPAGAATVFSPQLERLPPGARVLDCAAGTGQLAVGLAAAGYDVVATDASEGMIERTRALATEHAVEVTAHALAWVQLRDREVGQFDAVLCVGNSIAHAEGQAARRAALAAMAGVLRDGGLLVLTSRNWERVRERGSGLEVWERTIERHGRHAVIIYGWTIPAAWEEPHHVDVAVAMLGGGGAVETAQERLTMWPFTHDALRRDLEGAGLTPSSTTYNASQERYLVTATMPAAVG
jgi:SAM-dependent methyltransferase